MLAFTDPREAYSRSDFELRVKGAPGSADLVRLCLEQAIGGLGLAVIAHERGEAAARSKALSRSLSAIIALDMGVDRDAPLAGALLRMYGGARQTILDSVVRFDPDSLTRLRTDFVEISAALRRA